MSQQITNQIDSAIIHLSRIADSLASGQILKVEIALEIQEVCVFDPVLRLFIRRVGECLHLISSDTHQGKIFLPWLPRGAYQFVFAWPVSLPEGNYELGVAWGTVGEIRLPDFIRPLKIESSRDREQLTLNGEWFLEKETQQKIANLSWQKGMDSWFHRHFCHAAEVIGKQFMANSEKLCGRVLDIGAGDGITDIGLILRYQPKELVAMDIVGYMSELTRVAQENDLPLERLPDNLIFLQQSCEHVPYPDEYFDVVLSWGSVEHIIGGYKKALNEVWRVLKPGGLFFVNPGLYYAAYGSHLGEFSEIPHLHLKISEQELHDLVMESKPKVMDRAGFNATNADYWRFYKELNRIKVTDFETEIKQYGYKIIRAAIRSSDMVEYDLALQQYSIVDLGIEDVFFVLQKPESA